jgi:hypothetical protein
LPMHTKRIFTTVAPNPFIGQCNFHGVNYFI